MLLPTGHLAQPARSCCRLVGLAASQMPQLAATQPQRSLSSRPGAAGAGRAPRCGIARAAAVHQLNRSFLHGTAIARLNVLGALRARPRRSGDQHSAVCPQSLTACLLRYGTPTPPQMAIVTLLLLRNSGPLPPPLRLLYWGTYALSFAVLGLSVFARHRYPALRPHLLVCVRVFYDLLCPQLVWHLASQNSRGRSAEQGSWPSECAEPLLRWGCCCCLGRQGAACFPSLVLCCLPCLPCLHAVCRSCVLVCKLPACLLTDCCCRPSFPAGFFLLWVTWTRWGSELLTRERRAECSWMLSASPAGTADARPL